MTSARRQGMTLIEAMVAITILAMVALIVFGGFSTTMRNKARLEEQADRSHVIRVAMERMVRELSSAYVSLHRNPNPSLQVMNTCFIGGQQGRGARLDFTSFSHRRLFRDAHESDQNELSYFVTNHPEESGRYVLARREARRIDDDPQTGGTTQILVEDVVGFELEYFDAVNQQWIDTWNANELTAQPNRLPTQIKIRLIVPQIRDRNRHDTFSTRATPMITWGLNHAIYQ
jgi:general secretion pathway protein J